MEPLLAQYRHWLQFQTLLGISPFTVSSDGRTLRQTPAITVYAFITIAAFVLSLSILTYVEIVYGVPESGGSDTIWVVDSLENCIVAVIFDSLMLVSVLRRRQHCRFIEAFAEFHDRWMLQQRNDSSETSRTRNVRRMCVINGVLTAVYLVCISSSILLFLDYIREWDQVVFTMLHHMAITYEFVTLLHIWDFVRLLGDAYVRCAWTILLGGERSSSGGSSDDDPENVWLDWTAAFAVDLERTMCAFKNCFGVHVLLFQTRDILCITGVSFFLLGSYFNGRIRIANYIYMFTYLMPTMAKSMLLIVSMAELNEKIRQYQAALLRKRLPDGYSIDVHLHQFLHVKHFTAAGFFPVDLTQIFQLLSGTVTYLVILMQFQQWETNQYEAEETANNGTVF